MFFALAALALVIVAGLYASRRLQRGYIDLLSPLLVLYAIHVLTRATLLHLQPDWLDVHERVAAAPATAILGALMLTTLSLAILIVGYLLAVAIIPCGRSSPREITPLSLDVAATLVGAGMICHGLLRLNAEGEIGLPDWATTPIETLGWAVLAGVFSMAFTCGRRPAGARAGAAWLTAVVVAATLVVDDRLSLSRESTLQPLLAALIGYCIGAELSPRRIAMTVAIVGLPLFLWIGAMKTYADRGLGGGIGYLEALPRAREYSGLTWPQWAVAAIQNRFHGFDSLVVTQSLVPSVIPYQSDSLWGNVLISAFVPRAAYADKQIGWGLRFATEFWGVSPEAQGRVAVGISHLGNFYLHGGVWSCLTGMAILGLFLGTLATLLRSLRTIAGPTLFVLTAFSVCQVDRDLEVVLGGVLKQLTILGILFSLLPLRRASIVQAPSRISARLAIPSAAAP